ncbi:MAG: TonB family protein, partial [Vicinamibacterales bacterium]
SQPTPMMISLGGTPGPRSGGMTPIGGRPVQQVTPLPPVTKSTPVAPPAPKAPEMVLPQRDARARPATPTRVKTPDEAKARKPATGAEVRAGSAVAETGGQGTGFGLTTGGGGGTGGYLDVGNFCCPEYLETMRMLITRNWRSQQRAQGTVQVKFTIQRSGALTEVELEKRSGYFVLDTEAQRAILLTKQLPPLPPAFTEGHLTVHLIFEYRP